VELSAVYSCWHARVLATFSPDLIISSSEASAIAERLEELLMGQVPMPSRAACRQYAHPHFDWHKIVPGSQSSISE